MRNVAILFLSSDAAVGGVLQGLRANTSSWHEVAAESFGQNPQSLSEAVHRLVSRSGEFDTLLLVTHGREENNSSGEIQFQARTATVGGVLRSHWYLISEELAPVLDEGIALVTTVCFSSQDEFREAISRRLPAYAIAGVETLSVVSAVSGTLAFFRVSQAFDIEDLGQVHDAIVEAVRTASKGQLAAWMPGHVES